MYSYQNPAVDGDPVLPVDLGLLHEPEVGNEPVPGANIHDRVHHLIRLSWLLLKIDTK